MGNEASVHDIVIANRNPTIVDTLLTAGETSVRRTRSLSVAETQNVSNKRVKSNIRRRSTISAPIEEKFIVDYRLYEDYFCFYMRRNREMVPNQYKHHRQSLPDIEHYAILFYYLIKDCSIQNMLRFWHKLYTLYDTETKENIFLPRLFIAFERIDAILFEEHQSNRKWIRRLIQKYYTRWHPKCIAYSDNTQLCRKSNGTNVISKPTKYSKWRLLYGTLGSKGKSIRKQRPKRDFSPSYVLIPCKRERKNAFAVNARQVRYERAFIYDEVDVPDYYYAQFHLSYAPIHDFLDVPGYYHAQYKLSYAPITPYIS